MKDYEDKKMKCSNCSKEYILRTFYHPANLESRNWLTYYCCPYCNNKEADIRLRGNEDVNTYKID